MQVINHLIFLLHEAEWLLESKETVCSSEPGLPF